MAEAGTIRVEVVLAGEGGGRVSLAVSVGTTAWQAVELSQLLAGRAHPDVARLGVAVFGRQVAPDRVLEDADRVEILRPLPHDPRLRRRQLARKGRVMGRG